MVTKMKEKHSLLIRMVFSVFLLILCTGCFLDVTQTVSPTRAAVVLPSVTAPPTIETSLNTLPDNLYDALGVMQGICFEAAWDAAGRIFIMRSAEEHIQFYDDADNASLCRHAVERYPFDFSGGDVLAGLWNRAMGCKASHEVIDYQRDESTKTIQITVRFITEGNCSYELVRGFWVGILNAQDFEIIVEQIE
jgi:hypothetical protein